MTEHHERGYPDEVLRYVARFDRGEYWLAHEQLEELWLEDRQDPFKGLIQIAAAYLHLERENWRGARRLLRTALDYLGPAPDDFAGFDLVALREHSSRLLDHVSSLASGETATLDDKLLFSLSPFFAGEVAEGMVQDVELPYRVRRYADGYRPGRAAPGADRKRSRPEHGDRSDNGPDA